MKFLNVLLLLLMSSCSSVETKSDKTHQISIATNLYSCHYFFKLTAESTSDLLLNSRFIQIADSLLLQARGIALEAGGESLNQKLSNAGKLKFERFMSQTQKIISTAIRNQHYMDFSKSCADQSGVILNAG